MRTGRTRRRNRPSKCVRAPCTFPRAERLSETILRAAARDSLDQRMPGMRPERGRLSCSRNQSCVSAMGNTPWFAATRPHAKPKPASAAAANSSPRQHGAPLWQQSSLCAFAIESGSLDVAFAQGGRALDAQSKLTVTTDETKPGLIAVRFEISRHGCPDLPCFLFPVARGVVFVECAATAARCLEQHRIEFLHVGGASIAKRATR